MHIPVFKAEIKGQIGKNGGLINKKNRYLYCHNRRQGSDATVEVVIVTGNPGVTARDPYPTHRNPYPSTQVGVSAGRGKGLAGFFIITTG